MHTIIFRINTNFFTRHFSEGGNVGKIEFWLTEELEPFITPILKSLVVPVIWLALIDAIYSQIAPFFALNRIFFPANEVATLKTQQPIRFQGLFKVTRQIAGKWKTKSVMRQILQLLFQKLLFIPPKNGWI